MTVIPLSDIQDDGTTRMRVAGIDPSVVADNADAMEAGAVFPPIIVYHDGEQYWPGDGFHRIDAARRIGRETINADIREGGRRDALLLAASANATHGLRRTQADKRKSVETLLRDLEWSRWSDCEIGEPTRLSHSAVRPQVSGSTHSIRPALLRVLPRAINIRTRRTSEPNYDR